jgi:hypothetical protein
MKSLGDTNFKHLDEAKFAKYVDPIRLLINYDKRTKDEIEIVFEYLKSESSTFWKPNVLSTEKLRKQFSKLLMAANKVNPESIQETVEAENYDHLSPAI